ncbi:hypothetical protein CDAR_615221 [Caerostris darwini]|uniref:Uncharacterized protein n=1 Tax=Caerostris darwini TaxID=1538125 RepID=A0AAV4R8Q1_9ARAC|nr:hypothetical protein CDAR_615221 [Caerostris darwini]
MRLKAPMTFRQSRHLEKKSGLFTPRLARSALICVVGADNTFRALLHSGELTNSPLQDSSFISPLIIRHTRNADCHFVSERAINRAPFTFEIVVLVSDSLLLHLLQREVSLVK